ncbi:hypothetical protein FOH24_12335 [Acetobacter tropicalis]|nr:hypothetical protein [Acetobacter tropicalis]ATI12991.1 hypothetical protein CPF11_11470 [Acetobacter pomorum]KAA8388632.1 hypothetical protein FOH24_12335 [Acetobacter tropicalis]KAA8391190.1 hypothetical protein FOH22_00780 [Acetobacter tropicalis]MBC9009280.1 hypothetical protein [Acetobacter tropicalis]MDO8170678.1 hypothetical protein [Acetobacter tropicalis]
MSPSDVEEYIRVWLEQQGQKGDRPLSLEIRLEIYKITTSRASALNERANSEKVRKMRQNCEVFATALNTIEQMGPLLAASLGNKELSYKDKEEDELALEGLRKAARWLINSPNFLPYRGNSLDSRSGGHWFEVNMLEALDRLLTLFGMPSGMQHPTGKGIDLAYRLLAYNPERPEDDEKCPSVETLVQRWKRSRKK